MPIPPEIREGFLTFPEARASLANKSAWSANLRGDLQMHTQWSDGSGSIEEMARAATDRGYEYIAITDHSKGLRIAGGINWPWLSRRLVVEMVGMPRRRLKHCRNSPIP